MTGPDFNLQTVLRDYHNTNVDAYDEERLSLVVLRLDRTGAVDNVAEVARFDDFLLRGVSEQEDERIQFMPSSDANKIYAFGQDHHVFDFSGVLLDTKLSRPVTAGEDSWSGESYKEFVQFFTQYANIGVCARNRYIVMARYANRFVYGTLISMTAQHSAMNEFMYQAGFSFYVAWQEAGNG